MRGASPARSPSSRARRKASAGPWHSASRTKAAGSRWSIAPPLIEEVRHEAEAAGDEAIAIMADLETFAGATAAIDAAQQHFGRIDILVNNVGGTIWAKPYVEYEEAQIEAEIRRSLFPTLWCCRAVLPGMLDRGAGVIINVSSVATRGVNRVPYAAAKGASTRSPSLSRWNTRRAASASAAWRPAAPMPHRGASRATPQSRAPRRRNGTARSWTRRSRRA
jgi:NAD(P)-dependent dehydrogenase (short-subunit alcohol dehydrogenase family)